MAVSREKISKQLIFKVIVVGDSGVGKTSLTHRFCSGKFSEEIRPTVGLDFQEKNIDVDGEAIKLQFWDTAGTERFRSSIGRQYYRNVHAVVFVYDATERSSFDNLRSWIEECNSNHLDVNIPRILVGNKCDRGDEIKVATKVAKRFADDHRMPLYETSAKENSSGYEVEAIPVTIAHKVHCRPPMMTSSSGPSSSFSLAREASNISVTVNGNVNIGKTSSKRSCC